MRLGLSLVGALLVVGAVGAQEGSARAWQRRLAVEVGLPLPIVELAPVNPFYRPVDAEPRLDASVPPRKAPVSGHAVVAAYVDSEGRCRGAVPLELPFPALTATLVGDLTNARFEAARADSGSVATWSVIDIRLDGRAKDSELFGESLSMPDPADPPQPAAPSRLSAPGPLRMMPAEAPANLDTVARPRNLRVRAPARDADVALRALVHVTAAGRCDRWVPLELDSGLYTWFALYLASWRLEPARRDGEATDVWVVYSARARIKLSSLSSSRVEVLRDRSYDPRGDG